MIGAEGHLYLVDAQEHVSALVLLPQLRDSPGDVGVCQLGSDDGRFDAPVHRLDGHAPPVVQDVRVA